MAGDLVIPAVTQEVADMIPAVVKAVVNAHGLGSVQVAFRPGLGLAIGQKGSLPGMKASPGVQALPVELTGRGATAGSFTWREKEWLKDTGIWGTKSGGLTNASDDWGLAWDFAKRRTIPLGSIQYISQDPYLQESDGKARLVFAPRQAWVLMKITGITAGVTNGARWTYKATEVKVASDFTVTTITDGLTDEPVRNSLEITYLDAPSGTTAWYVGGVQANPSANATAGTIYPTSFQPRPVGGGGFLNTHKRDVIVKAWESELNPGALWFTAPFSHDGGC